MSFTPPPRSLPPPSSPPPRRNRREGAGCTSMGWRSGSFRVAVDAGEQNRESRALANERLSHC